MTEIDVAQEKEVTIIVGGDTDVIINKLYGPTGGCDIRVRMVRGEAYQWVIERQRHTDRDGLRAEWVEIARCDLQAEDDAIYQDDEG